MTAYTLTANMRSANIQTQARAFVLLSELNVPMTRMTDVRTLDGRTRNTYECALLLIWKKLTPKRAAEVFGVTRAQLDDVFATVMRNTYA